MNVATVCIPIALAHESLYYDALTSVQAQTIQCDVMLYFDKFSGGAGFARNQAAFHTETLFITFLDADDILEPTFIEECLEAYKPGHYVYSGWYAGDTVHMPMAKTPYKGDSFHLVTTLIPTVAFNAIGGFDEDLPGHEDCDLHLKLAELGICGILVPKPLIHYRPHGFRGNQFRASPEYQQIRQSVYDRNGGEKTIMCCGKDLPIVAGDMGEKREGDVLAMALWDGNRTEGSVADPSRKYRGGNGSSHWVHPDDIKARPTLWRRLHTNETLTPDKQDVLKAAGLR